MTTKKKNSKKLSKKYTTTTTKTPAIITPKPLSVLCVPDCHIRPGEDYYERAKYLVNIILEARPDTILWGGDVWEMESLCGWNQTVGSKIGKNIRADIDCGKDFLNRIMDELKKVKDRYNPTKIKLLGNHTEARIKRVLDEDMSLIGTIGLNDLDLESWADIIVKYNGKTPGILEYPEKSNILWSHFFTQGNFIKPISGINAGSNMLNKLGTSNISFHSHLLDFSTRVQGNGRTRITSLIGGCFVGDDPFDYAGNASKQWARGLSLLTNVGAESGFDFQWIGIERLKQLYG